ncbi:tetracenomycin polyketide synthesis 8-O-methyl transferase TcmO [Geobacter sp. OR-1]|uniref:methyltransferase n=1 Tax=Geobacter sp. OR-1 TaxID=1266765 RepID=UPI000543D5A2|nr:methyltransferase [Geobacter sp. OR-1]GAM11074.1 tetracenomycin polyketide synthesis 8-O-methyl transferase TcmO [Geobacter sp. OR-1]
MDNQQWTPASLLQLSGGYWSTCALHAAVKLDLFTALGDRECEVQELVSMLSLNPRGLEMLLNALAALNLVDKIKGVYRATPFATEFLSRNSPRYLGYIIQHHHHLMSGWSMLDVAVQSGQPVRERVSHADDEKVRECFEMGMFNLAMLIAPKIVTQIDLAGRRRLLDLGGGPGTYAIHFCQQNPELDAVVYDLPSTRRFAEQTIARFGMEQRISFEDGDFVAEGIKGRFDVAWLSHILHGEGAENCAVILDKAVAALEPGGILLVQEFILDDKKDGPEFPALFSLNMLIGTESGQAYSRAELFAMMAAAGLVDLKREPIDLPNGAGVISGRIP